MFQNLKINFKNSAQKISWNEYIQPYTGMAKRKCLLGVGTGDGGGGGGGGGGESLLPEAWL